MSALPEGWEVSDIENVLGTLPSGKQIDQGWSPRCENFPSADENTWGALKTTAIQDGWFEQQHTKQLPEHLDPKPELEVKVGDLLLTCAGPRIRCGVICRVDAVRKRLFISGKMYRFRPDEEVVDPDYMMAFLRAPDQQYAIDQIKTGGSESGLNLTQARFRALKFTVPPLAEQRRIVEKLDQLSARTRAAKDLLARVQTLAIRAKQTTLAAAFRGELTEDWRAEHPELEPWETVELSQVAEGFNYGSAARSSKEGSVPVLRMGNIQDGLLDWADRVVTSDAAEIKKFELLPGDVLFNRTNSPALVGKTALYRGERPAIFAGYLIRVRCSDRLLPEFLNYSLNGPEGRAYSWSVKSDGVSQSNINAKKLKAFCFELPPLEEQTEIVRRIEAAFARIDRMVAEAARAAALLERLAAQLLAKAFRGELVPQDPTDEPASALLARIREARANAPKPTTRRRS